MVTEVEGPPEPPETLTDPRELLVGYLDWYRDAVLRKLDGLGEEELRRSRLPSGWTPLALLKHLAGVERRWFRWGFAGERVGDPDVEFGPDGRWHVGPLGEGRRRGRAGWLSPGRVGWRCRPPGRLGGTSRCGWPGR
jgi:hypothetical protein